MYQSGDWVVYGIHGVCRVIGTEKQLVNRKRTEFLVLQPTSGSESRFYLPTGNPSAMGKLKNVLSAEELKELLASDLVRQECWIREENLRKQRYRDLISSGDRISVLQMIHALYRYKEDQLSAGKKFHQCDDNFLRDAEKLMISEISLVLEMSREDARDYLRSQLHTT